MARQRKKNSTAKKTTVDEEGKADDEDKRFVTPETGIPQALDSIQLFHWMKGMGSAPNILHGQERKELEEPVAVQTQAAPITNIAADPVMDTQPQVAVKTKTNTDPAPSELEMAKAARKLTFTAGVEPMKPTLAAVVQEAIRYRLQVRAIDGISLLLWDRGATKLIGKSDDTLKEGVVETSGAAYECSHSLEIEAILDRKFIFKLTIKPSNIEENDEVYIVVKDPDFNNEQVTSGDTRDKDSMADNEMVSPKRTPTKRTRDDDGATTVEVDDDVGQLSSNGVKRVIKKEKNP
ncbi:hypothetical protein A4A49_21331 [Nicotiana attenuata]|uniref:Uncharacterized protein n=1 Tax=Nicotiana attenuata TaxID=49451 RepID=A0A1J6HWE9_NICAT|nr:hypothetical protein A4A49_21331 [Nicotiana attenuata]